MTLLLGLSIAAAYILLLVALVATTINCCWEKRLYVLSYILIIIMILSVGLFFSTF